MGGWSTESGTSLISVLGSKPIGDINVGKDSTILFLPDNKIVLWNFILNTFTTLIEEDELNFSTQYPIHGVSKVIKGCERVIYFTDFNNPMRAVNIDNIEQYYEDDVFVVDRIKLSRPIDFVNISNIQVYNSGGSLSIGSYRFAYRFVDVDGNTTAWSSLSNRINIIEDSTSGD